MMRRTRPGFGVVSSGLVLVALGCGSADGNAALFAPLEPPGQVRDVPPDTTSGPLTPVDVAPNVPSVPALPEGTVPGMVASPPPSALPAAPANGACRPALGVSGAPETISQAIILMNTLPKPTTLACFLEALERPLTLYMTQSNQSLQPSPGARSPRTFVVRGDLVMSIVLEGPASHTLELGYRPIPTRSIKAEIEFPISRDVNEATLFDRIQVTERTTVCGACHVGEEHREFPGFPSGVFESDVFAPFDLDEVSVESLRADAASCDDAAEAFRCGLLSALYDHGELVQGALPAIE